MEREKICYSCMRKMDENETVCKYCGFNYDVYMQHKDYRHLNPGELLKDRYRIGVVLGAGGFGISYIGFDELLQVKIAIKEYFPAEIASRNTTEMTHYSNTVNATLSEEAFQHGLEKFLNEARTLARFNGMRGIVSITDFFHENGTGYMIMDYLPGQSLRRIIKDKQELITEQEVIDLISPIMDALETIHKAGLIHRDISPDNLLMDSEGKLTLIDFGAAREVANAGKSLTIVLKHGYAPIEQYTTTGQQGPWTDIYALCATIYYMVTHAVPETATDRVIDDRMLSLEELGMPVSGVFSDMVAKGLAIHAEDRFQSIEEMKHFLSQHSRISKPVNRRTTGGYGGFSAGDETFIQYDSVHPAGSGAYENYNSGTGQSDYFYDGRTDPAGNGGYQNGPAGNGGYQNGPTGNGGYQNDPTGNGGYQNGPVGNDGYQSTTGGYNGYQVENKGGGSGGKGPGNFYKYAVGGMLVVCIVCVAVILLFVMRGGQTGTGAQTESVETATTAWKAEDEMETMSGTYVTYQSNEYHSIAIYEQPGDSKKSAKIPEAHCVQMIGKVTYEGETWYKVDYCGKRGWLQENYVRYLSDEDYYFQISTNAGDNVVFVDRNLIKLHTEPNDDSSYAAQGVPYGTELTVTELDTGWGKVTYNGKECWVDLNYVGEYATQYRQVEICNGKDDSINLRKSADEDSQSITKLRVGTVLLIETYKNGWGKVNYGGLTGWVKLSYTTPCPSSGLDRSEDLDGL